MKRLNDAGFDNAQIVKKGDWYRTVVQVEEPGQRQQVLDQIQSKIRRSAYAVDMKRWCAEGADCAQVAE